MKVTLDCEVPCSPDSLSVLPTGFAPIPRPQNPPTTLGLPDLA